MNVVLDPKRSEKYINFSTITRLTCVLKSFSRKIMPQHGIRTYLLSVRKQHLFDILFEYIKPFYIVKTIIIK